MMKEDIVRKFEESLDDLAASVVAAEPDDLPILGEINNSFNNLAELDQVPPVVRLLAQEGASLAEKIVLREMDDPDMAIARLGQVVEALQQIARCVAREEPLDTVELPDWFEYDIAGEKTTGETTSDAAAEDTPQDSQSDSTGEDANIFDLPADADTDLVAEFITESLDHIVNSEGALLELEANQDPEQINTIFRAFHTIKGTSGFLGLAAVNKVAHKAETLLDRARKGEIVIAGGYADLVLDSCDMLKKLIEYVSARMEGADCSTPEGVDDLIAHLESPDLSEAEDPEAPRLGDILVAEGKAKREDVEAVAADGGKEKIGTRLIKKNVAKPKDVAKAIRTQKAVAGKTAESSVRVTTGRLDTLINMVGEMVIAQAMVAQDSVVVKNDSQALGRNISQLGKITRELQELTLSMRMVPLKNTFQKMARLVRDLARKSGKAINFVTEGEDTEIDRNMVEAINDPLVHMMRNSVDHGIESREDRAAAGKPETGTVTLRAYHAAGNVVIEIIDDGKGLDKDKILKKAIEKGIIEPGREPPDSEVFNFIMGAGFSTADKVTDVSGRGVGMDVVRRNIESLRGKQEIASKKGKGTTITVRLPLTLAIIDGMLLRVGRDIYIVSTAGINQAFRPQKDAISTVAQKGEMVLLRGTLIPIVRLHRLFNVKEAQEDFDKSLLVVVENDNRHCALLIDEIIGQQQIVIKSLGKTFGNIRGISGGAILGDGHVGLILDVAGLLDLALNSA